MGKKRYSPSLGREGYYTKEQLVYKPESYYEVSGYVDEPIKEAKE